MVPVIAIDGPSASGKGTLARRIAAALGMPHLDTGLLYRAVGRRVLDAGADPRDATAAARAARTLTPDDLDRTDLRTPEADEAASVVAAIPEVRAALVAFQRSFAGEFGAVLDGRDIGTAIFPDAAAKLFVTASVEERARRRWQEQLGRGETVEYATVLEAMRVRDTRDSGRDAAPLRPADDALVLDTTTLDPDEAFAAAMELVRRKLPIV